MKIIDYKTDKIQKVIKYLLKNKNILMYEWSDIKFSDRPYFSVFLDTKIKQEFYNVSIEYFPEDIHYIGIHIKIKVG